MDDSKKIVGADRTQDTKAETRDPKTLFRSVTESRRRIDRRVTDLADFRFSPDVWGAHRVQALEMEIIRFIPASLGNTINVGIQVVKFSDQRNFLCIDRFK